jgi:hypothetical protein
MQKETLMKTYLGWGHDSSDRVHKTLSSKPQYHQKIKKNIEEKLR